MAILIRQAAGIPRACLDRLGTVEIPLTEPPAQLRGERYEVRQKGARMFGVWECSPGRWRRTIMEEEFAHFVSGSARFVPDEGEPIEIRAGDTIWFPPNSCGVWEITEDVRKVYIIVYQRSLTTLIRRAAKKLSALWRKQAPAPVPRPIAQLPTLAEWRATLTDGLEGIRRAA
jgi:uncharacterized cupin superfamily protein